MLLGLFWRLGLVLTGWSNPFAPCRELRGGKEGERLSSLAVSTSGISSCGGGILDGSKEEYFGLPLSCECVPFLASFAFFIFSRACLHFCWDLGAADSICGTFPRLLKLRIRVRYGSLLTKKGLPQLFSLHGVGLDGQAEAKTTN